METFSVATDIVKQLKRILKPDGQFLLFTFAGPEVYQYVLEEEGGLTIKDLCKCQILIFFRSVFINCVPFAAEIALPWGSYYFYQVAS
jgi:ubiquinone/menaquinone biosynthesis C-methylase UbiE